MDFTMAGSPIHFFGQIGQASTDGEIVRRKVERILQAITLQGDLDEAQRTRLMEIAGKCPVHRTITGELEIIDIAAPVGDPTAVG